VCKYGAYGKKGWLALAGCQMLAVHAKSMLSFVAWPFLLQLANSMVLARLASFLGAGAELDEEEMAEQQQQV
jgi:hypothetical protein